MSNKGESSSGGLFSKVVRFVRNPTVNWTELDSLDTSKESQYSKQMLKEMIERKRSNDFVRKREFDQLRKLRQRDASSLGALDDPAARPSFFQSSLTMPEDRAGTIKKIDEIEAQMSMQWWKSNYKPEGANSQISQPSEMSSSDSGVLSQSHATSSATGALSDNGAEALGVSTAGSSQWSLDSASAPHSSIFANTAPLTLPVHLTPQDSAPVIAMDMLMGNGLPTEPATAMVLVDATAAEQPVFMHDQDMEEAAILFANGDIEGAELSLKGLLIGMSADDPLTLERWLALFDLYRAMGKEAPFEELSIEFAARFGRSAPLWYSLPELLGVQDSEGAAKRDFQWVAPAALLPASVEHLWSSSSRAGSPWTLSWSRLSRIEPAAFKPLGDVFAQWADQTVQIQMIDVDRLMTVLMDATPSGDASCTVEAWRARMSLLRLLGRMDEFEMVALDFCVTYEVSPPSWIEPKCQCRDADPAQSVDGSSEGAETGQAPVAAGLSGAVQGDATDALTACDALAPVSGPVIIACERVIRVDFSAAGSVLNWAAQQQQQQRQVIFQRVNRLVAVFFNVVGINEHALIIPRKD